MFLCGCLGVLGSLIFSSLVMQKAQDRMLSNVILYLLSIHPMIWCINNMHFLNGAGRCMLCLPEVPCGLKWIRNLHKVSNRVSEILPPWCHFSACFLFSICNILFLYFRRGQADHGKIISFKTNSRHQEVTEWS